MKREWIVTAVVLVVLLIDQSLKVWVKTNMHYQEEIHLFGLEWARLFFVENNGMAFGITLGEAYGKLALSLFRLAAVGFLLYYLRFLMRNNVNSGVLISFALILAGALGNIIDSAFYGMIFSESTVHGEAAKLFPPEGGYSDFLHGRVVDMFFFPIFEGYFPHWFPLWAGKPYLFFRPVFNIADVSITAGVLNILLFQRQFFTSSRQFGPAEPLPAAVATGESQHIDGQHTWHNNSITSEETEDPKGPENTSLNKDQGTIADRTDAADRSA